MQVVHGYWTLLIRQTNQSALCQPGPDGCTSSLIPLNHTIVVPGGRYREIYYWDSYWILEGLLASELNNYAWNLLQNFMDMVEVSSSRNASSAKSSASNCPFVENASPDARPSGSCRTAEGSTT